MRYKTSDRTFNFTTRNVNKDKIIDEKWPLLFGLLEEINNTSKAYGSKNAIEKEEILDIGRPVYRARFTRS